MDRIPPSSNYGYFAEQARRAEYMQQYGRTHEFARDHLLNHHFSHTYTFRQLQHGPYPYPPTLPPTHPHGMHEAIQREIEKERIREEIIMSEIARRRILDAEVRRELMAERELATRRGIDGFPFASSPGMGLESSMRPSVLGTRAEGRSTEERFTTSLEETESPNGWCKSEGFDPMPFQRRAADIRVSEVKPVMERSKEKERIVLLAKPAEGPSGSKRKAVLPAELDASELSSDVILSKRAKEEWNCALCQVNATSEQGLNEHLQGKRHKSKEAALRAQRGGKNYSIGLFPKKAPPRNLVCETIDPGIEGGGMKVKAVYMPLKQIGETSSKKDGLLALQKTLNSEVVEIVSDVRKVFESDDSRKDLKTGVASLKSDDLQTFLETQNFDDLKHKQSEVQRVSTIDDSMKKELNTGDPVSKKVVLQPLQQIRNSNVMVKKSSEVQKVLKNNASDKKELVIGGASSKRDDLLALQKSQNPGNLMKKQSEIQKVRKKDGSKKKGFHFFCEICHVEITCPKVVDDHMNGKRHARNVKRLAKSDQTGGGVPCTVSEMTTVFSDDAVGATEDGKTVALDNAHQTLEQLRFESRAPMNGIKPEHNKTGISVDESQTEDCGVADAAKLKHELNNDKARPNGQGETSQLFQETRNSDDLTRKQSEVEEVQPSHKVDGPQAEDCGGTDTAKLEHDLSNDKVNYKGQEVTVDGIKAEGPTDDTQSKVCGEHTLIIDKVEPKGQELNIQPSQGTQNSGDLKREQSEVLKVQMNDDSRNNELMIVGASLTREDVKPLHGTPNSKNLKKCQSEVQTVQKNNASANKVFKTVKACSMRELQEIRKQFTWEREQSEDLKVRKADGSPDNEFKSGEAISKGDGLSRKQLAWKRKQSEVQTAQKNDVAKKKELSKFWCDICKVGAPSLKTMNSHKTGRKHLSRVKELASAGIAIPVPPFVYKTISVAPYTLEQIASGSHHAGGVAGDGKTLPPDSDGQTLESAMSESLEPMDGINNIDQSSKLPSLKGYEPIDGVNFVDQNMKETRLGGHDPMDGVTNIYQNWKQQTGALPVAPFAFNFSVAPFTENEKTASFSHYAVCVADGKAVMSEQPNLETHKPMDDGIKPMNESATKGCGALDIGKARA